MKSNGYILTYEQALHVGACVIGSKSYNIAYCHKSGFHLPEGFIVTNDAFRMYLNDELEDDFYSQIEGFLKNAASIFVRSSALEEDKEDISFAGQYLSVICNCNAAEIKKACEACWSSYFSSSAESYLENIKNDTAQGKRGMGLIIQKAVDVVSSGVCFTRDPMDQNKNTYVINAVHGLGEALMSGEVIADQYAVSVQTDIIDYKLSGKQAKWRSLSDHHVLTAIPPALKSKIVLSEKQILEIKNVAQKVVTMLGSPQDIEWAYDTHQLFLLQTRPITTGKRGNTYELWTRDNVADVIPDVVTTLTWSILGDATNSGFKEAIRKLGLLKNPASLFALFDGRAYCNLTNYQGILSLKEGVLKIPGIVLRYGYLLLTLKRNIKHLDDQFQQQLDLLSKASIINAMRGLKKMLDTYMSVHIQIAILMNIGFLVIRKLIAKSIPENEVNPIVDGLVTGLNKVESSKIAESLIELALSISNNKGLVQTLLDSAPEEIPGIIKKSGGKIAESWETYLKKYGYASLKEFEIYYPRWEEEPSFLSKTILQYLRKGTEIDLNASRTTCEKKRVESAIYLLRSTSLLRYVPLKYYIKHVRRCSIWREFLKQKLVRIMAEFRKRALAFAGEMNFEPLENVFFLTMDEIYRIKKSPMASNKLKKIDERKTAWEISNNEEAFKEIRVYDDGRKVKVPYLYGVGTNLQGSPLSSGKYKGRARIILNPNDMDVFSEGDILVAPSTNPSWTPLFALAGAIVTDMGNYLSHGSIVAREMGIPAVGNLFHATKVIKDGEIIEVDGNTGSVTII